MKNAIISFLFVCLGFINIHAQSNENTKNQVIVKKITIQNIDGKESRTETIDTFDSANWKNESLSDKDVEIIIKDNDKNGEISEENEEAFDPEVFNHNWVQLQDDQQESVLPPNKAVLGVQLSNVNGENGAQIVEVFEGSAAEKAGLQEGDILLSVNSKETANVDAVINALSGNKPGDKVKVTYLRGTKVKDLKATLQEREEEMMSMKKCSPACMSKMRSCKPGEIGTCLKKLKGIDSKVDEQIERELEQNGLGKNSENKKIIIIKKNPGEVRILRNKGTGANEMELRSKNNSSELVEKTEGKESLKVEYLTSSPNPSNGHMKIKYSGAPVPTLIQVLDLNGKEVYHEKIENFEGLYNKDVDIQNEAKGTLILKIIQGDKVTTQKIIVE